MDGSRPRLLERKPLLVGEWPPKTGEGPHGPLSARPAWVLCAILGITYETFLCMFERVNLLRHWRLEKPPRMSSLRFIADGLKLPGAPIVLLGRRVCQALGFPQANYTWDTMGDVPCVAIPHPSGKNLVYNHADERIRVKEVLERSLLYHGKLFRVGDWPDGTGSLVMIRTGSIWGDAARRKRHKSKQEQEKP